MKHIVTLLALALLASLSSSAQFRVQQTQELATPTNMFPALAGWHGGTAITANYNNRWPGIPNTNVIYGLSGDTYVPKLHSAFSLSAGHNRYSTGIMNINSLDFGWSPKLSTNCGLDIMPTLSIGYFQVAVDWAQTTFRPPGSPTPWPYVPGATPVSSNVNKLTFSSGLAMIYQNTFIALNVHDITQPDLSFFQASESRLPRTYSAMAGRIFGRGNWHFTPRVVYHRWGEFNHLNLGMNVQYKQFYIGSNYSWGDILGFAAGYEFKNQIRLSYSYDLTISRLATTTIGSHQLVMRVLLNKNRGDKRFLSSLPLM